VIAGAATDATALQSLDWIVLALGVALLVCWLVLRIRGRDPVTGGPPMEARFNLADAFAVFLLAFLSQVLSMGLLATAGLEESTDQQMLSFAVPLLVVWLAVRIYFEKRPEPGKPLRSAAWGALGFVAWFPLVYPVLLVTAVIYDAAGWDWVDQAVLERLQQAPPWKFFVIAVLEVPLLEETVFRGFLYRAFRRCSGPALAIPISALLFALAHVPDWPQMPALFVLGIGLAYLYERSGSLVTPIVFHTVFNGWTFLGAMLEKGG
jgi:membrane protease YdiL (CAAX protease family)